jgi:hypothetical protein
MSSKKISKDEFGSHAFAPWFGFSDENTLTKEGTDCNFPSSNRKNPF